GVLQDGAHLDRRAPAVQVVVHGRVGLGAGGDEQVSAGVSPAAVGGGLLPHVAVVEEGELVGQQVGDGVDVVAQVGDHPDPDLVGDLGERVGVRRTALGL